MKRAEFLKALLAAPSAMAASQVLKDRPSPQKDVQTVQRVPVNDDDAVFGYTSEDSGVTGEIWIMFDEDGNAWERDGTPVFTTQTF